MTDDDVIRRAVHELADAAPAPKAIQDRGPQGSRRWLATTAVGFVSVAGLVVVLWALTGESSLVTSDTTPPTLLDALPRPDTTPPPSVAEPETATTHPTTTSPVTPTTPATEPMLPFGSFDLTRDDVIARRVDGDVYLYPAALGDTPGEPMLLIDRDDPRLVPDEGTGPNYIDHVAGTYDGMLIYGDCCEPVAGNVYAIAEPGAEVDIFTSTGISDRARSLPHGFDPVLEPDGTRVVTSNWALVNVIDLATGMTTYASPGHGSEESINMTGEPFDALTATWTPGGMVVVVGRAADGQIIVTGHSPDDLRTELRRVVVDPTVRAPENWIDVDLIELTDDLISVVLYDSGGLRVVDVDATTFQLVDVDRDFPPPLDASVVRHSIERNAWAWIVDDVAYLHTSDGGTVEWQRDIADVWFPTLIDTRRPPSPTIQPTVAWQPVSIEMLPRLTNDAVPRLVLPDPDLPDPVRVEFSEASEATTDFVQVFGTPDGSGWLHIETSTRPQVPPSSWIEVEPIGPWTTYVSEFNGPGDHILWLTTGDLTVELWNNTVDADGLRLVAASLRQAETPTAGWLVSDLPEGFETIVEGPSYGGPVYSINYQDPSAAPIGLAAALEVSVDNPSLLSTYYLDVDGIDFDIVNVNGRRAVFLERNGVTPPTLIWEYQPRLVARLGIPDADPDTLIATAESLRTLDTNTWEQMATTTPGDGCPHFWC